MRRCEVRYCTYDRAVGSVSGFHVLLADSRSPIPEQQIRVTELLYPDTWLLWVTKGAVFEDSPINLECESGSRWVPSSFWTVATVV